MDFSLKLGQMSYGERLLALDMLPLAYDREIKDLVFSYKTVYSTHARAAANLLVILLLRPVRPVLSKLHVLFVL